MFGEAVPEEIFSRAVDAVTRCEVLLVVGCAMDVVPASELPRLARRHGAVVIECKCHPSQLSDVIGTHLLLGPAEESLPAVVASLDNPGR